MELSDMSLFLRLGIGVRLASAFAVVLLLLLIVAAAGVRGVSEVTDDLHTMYEDRAVPVEQLGEVNRLLVRNRVLVMDMMAFPSAENIARRDDELKKNIEAITATWDKFSKSRMSDAVRRNAEAFIGLRRSYVGDGLLPIRDAVKAGRPEEAQRVYQASLSPVAAKVNVALAELINGEISEGRHEFERAQADARRLIMVVVALSATALVLGVLLGWLITRSITRPLAQAVHIAETVARGDLTQRVAIHSNDETGRLLQALQAMVASLVQVVGAVRASSDSIATGSSQIATGNSDLSQRTEEQASNLQQTAASMEQLSSTVKANAETAQQAAHLATLSSQVAERGGSVVSQVVSTMEDISASSKRIANIIGVIDGIAFQTNILALNAAVEAARAGEQGRGFAVVASEVRSLAQRSAEAAREIKTLIGASVDRVEAGSRLVVDAGSTMQEILAQARKVADLLGEISSATNEQTTGIGQVSDAVAQLDQVTQQNAALVEDSAAAAESLRHQAAKLVDVVQVFRLDTGRGAMAAAA
jgi:methyl-accepting chemotaxis protein